MRLSKDGRAVNRAAVVFFVLLVAALGYIGPPSAVAAGQPAMTLKLAHAVETVMPLHKGAEKIAELATQNSNGAVKIELFPGGQLGGEKDITEGVQLGSIDMGIISSGMIGRFAPMQQIAYAPYLFRDVDHFLKVYHSPIGDEMAKQWTFALFCPPEACPAEPNSVVT